MFRKIINSLPFRKKKNGTFDEELADQQADDLGDGMSDASDMQDNLDDLAFEELPVEVQYERMPRRPVSRRSWLSKSLIITLLLTPIAVMTLALIPVLDLETGWRLFHAGGPTYAQAVPGTERELQEEIARGVRDVQDRNNADQEVPPSGDDLADGTDQGAQEDISDIMPNASDTQQQAAPDDEMSPEQLAALIEEEGSLDDPIEPDPLRPAPLPGLDEEGSFGRIPRIADDGTTPFDAYKRPFELQEDQPYVAVILTGVGLNEQRTESAINDLPLNISLGISPYARQITQVAARARAMGHEVFMELPMEPTDFPLSDPGPRALLTSLSEGENLVRLEWLLARFPGYVGLVTSQGAKFSSLDSAIRPIIEFIGRSGLMYVEASNRSTAAYGAQLAANAGTPNAIGNVIIDQVPSRRQIDARLAELTELAKTNGVAIGIAQSYPVSIQRLRSWASRLRRQGVQLVPVSALSGLQVTPQSSEEAEAARLEAQQRETDNTAAGDENAPPTETIEN
ncbi:divergent polysaccharide deacetylase family protein [Thalassospira sp. MA62]|nr:divergent polysaccharide deacetylase family protein [Thalassospira sp. MA62]